MNLGEHVISLAAAATITRFGAANSSLRVWHVKLHVSTPTLFLPRPHFWRAHILRGQTTVCEFGVAHSYFCDAQTFGALNLAVTTDTTKLVLRLASQNYCRFSATPKLQFATPALLLRGQIIIVIVTMEEFIYLILTRMPGESNRRRLRSLLMYLRYVFLAPINSLVC